MVTPGPQPARWIRLAAFAALVSLCFYIMIDIGLAWMYVHELTSPGCFGSPQPLSRHPGYQAIVLNPKDGIALDAWFYPPENSVALLALGGPGGALGDRLPPVEFLLDQGYGVLQVGSRACARPPSTVTLGANELADAQAGLEFLAAQPKVERIGVFGYSMGGATAIRLAARQPQIRSVVAEGGYFNLGKDIIEPGLPKPIPEELLLYTIAGFFWIRSGENPFQVSPIDDLPQISPRPLLLIYGEHELAGGRGDLQSAAARQPKEIWVVPGGGHGQNHLVRPAEYQDRILRFFEESLLNHRGD
jgi:pimeloyl-ACP methyl ester carboxylesterase